MDKKFSFSQYIPLNAATRLGLATEPWYGITVSERHVKCLVNRNIRCKFGASLEADGYVQRSNFMQSDGQIVDGWIKI